MNKLSLIIIALLCSSAILLSFGSAGSAARMQSYRLDNFTQASSFGSRSTTYTDTSAGTVPITASYSGDSNNAPSSASVTLTMSPTQTVVSLLPSESMAPLYWSAGSSTNESYSRALGCSTISGDLWNIADNSEGYVKMEEQSALDATVDFSYVDYANPSDGVVGYPHVEYGYNPFRGAETNSISALPLPKKIKDLPELVCLANYSLYSVTLPVNFAYDIWITKNSHVTSKPGLGDLELMIWTYYNGDIAPSSSFATSVGSVSLPTLVNGRNEQLEWNIWVSNGDRSQDHWTVVYIVLSNPIASGTVGVDLHRMLNEMGDALSRNYAGQWQSLAIQDYYLDSICLGSEFKVGSGNQATYRWNISNYCFIIDSQPLDSGVTTSNSG